MSARTGVSHVSRQWPADVAAWRRRDLSTLQVVSRFLDAIARAVRQGTDEHEGVLGADGMLETGQKMLLPLALGSRASDDAWLKLRA